MADHEGSQASAQQDAPAPMAPSTGQPVSAPLNPSPSARLRDWFHGLHDRMHANPVTGLVTKIVVTSVGVAVIIGGLVMMVAPGPGIVAIIIGLGILSLEWDWAERWMRSVKRRAREATARAREMDPAVRRRRMVLGTSLFLVVVGAVTGWILLYDWPGWSVSTWNWVQARAGFVPELPGM